MCQPSLKEWVKPVMANTTKVELFYGCDLVLVFCVKFSISNEVTRYNNKNNN